MAAERVLKYKLEADFSDVESKIVSIESRMQKALSASGKAGGGGSGGSADPNKAVTTELEKQAAKMDSLRQKYKETSDLATRLAAGGKENATELARVNTELAAYTKSMYKATADQQEKIKLLKQETDLRKQANELMGGKGTQFSPHSQRQNGMLEKLGGKFGVPGEITGALGAGEGLAGMAAAGLAVGALAAAAKLGVDALNQMGENAKRLAETFSDSGGKLASLRASTEALNVSQSKLDAATMSLGAGFENFKNGVLTDITNALADSANKLFNGGKQPGKITELSGEAKLTQDVNKRDRLETEQELAMSRQDFERGVFEKRRDYAMEVRQFELDTARKREDLERETARKSQDLARSANKEQRDYSISRQKLDEDFSFKQGQRKFQLEQSISRRDFGLKMGDKAQDFGKSQARSAQDYGDDLADMSASGASGLSFLQKSRDFRKQQSRATEDFQTEQGREGRDFNNKMGDDQAKNKIDVETHYYELRYQSLELENKHKDAVLENSIAVQRLTEDFDRASKRLKEDADIGREKLANKKDDMDFSESQGRKKMDISEMKTRRGMDEKDQDFVYNLDQGGKQRTQVLDLADKDPKMLADLNAARARRGLPPVKSLKEAKKQAALDMAKSKNFGETNDPNIGGYNPSNPDGYADGGIVDRDKLALVHAGEIVFNPRRPDPRLLAAISGGDGGGYGGSSNIMSLSGTGGGPIAGAGGGGSPAGGMSFNPTYNATIGANDFGPGAGVQKAIQDAQAQTHTYFEAQIEAAMMKSNSALGRAMGAVAAGSRMGGR